MGLIETCSLEEPKNCTVKVLKANLTVDDILKLPAFVRRNKNKKKTANAPTMPNLVSGEEFREALKKKIADKEEIEKNKLKRKIEREESKKIKDAQKEATKRKREQEREEKRRKREEEQI